MNQFSFDYMKTLIEISNDINSDFSNRDALLFRILKSAMRLVKCETSCFVTALSGPVPFRVISVFDEDYKSVSIDLTSSSFAGTVSEKNTAVYFNDVAENPVYYKFVKNFEPKLIETALIIPVFSNDKTVAVIELFNKSDGFEFNEVDVEISNMFSRIAATALENSKKYSVSGSSDSKSNTLSQGGRFHNFIAVSPVILDLMNVVKKAAVTNSSILVTGESGSGKELFAEQIYLNSRRADKPFVRVNCAALSETLMESELFGHEKGAFTSAESMQKGRFELADGGTIFLDEVGEIPLALQAKLLRVIQDRQFERVGSSQTLSVDVRIIAATNRNLEEMVRLGKFREDLYFRLNVLPIRVPPLRKRCEDILPIADMFLQKYSEESFKHFDGFSKSAEKLLKEYSWPGNVRELENVVARACIVSESSEIQPEDLGIDSTKSALESGLTEFSDTASLLASDRNGDRTLKTAIYNFKRSYLIEILKECRWNQTKAGQILGIQRTYVSRLMNELHIRENKTDI